MTAQAFAEASIFPSVSGVWDGICAKMYTWREVLPVRHRLALAIRSEVFDDEGCLAGFRVDIFKCEGRRRVPIGIWSAVSLLRGDQSAKQRAISDVIAKLLGGVYVKEPLIHPLGYVAAAGEKDLTLHLAFVEDRGYSKGQIEAHPLVTLKPLAVYHFQQPPDSHTIKQELLDALAA